MLYNSYDLVLENFLLDQVIISSLIFSSVLSLVYLILLEDILFWSLMGVKCSERTTSYQPEQDKKMKKLNRQIEKKFNITSVTAVKKKSLSLPRKVVNWSTGSVSST